MKGHFYKLLKMVWYNLTIGKYHLKYTPLKSNTTEYPYCDSKGNFIKRVVEGNRESYFIDDKGNKHQHAYRLVNGKPMAKLDKTKEVNNFKEVDKNEVEDLLTEKEYLVECDFLFEELVNSEKAIKFGFTNGNGFKVFKGYVYVDNLYKCLFMKLGTTQKSEVLQVIKEQIKNKKQVEKMTLTIEGVNKAKVEDLIEI